MRCAKRVSPDGHVAFDLVAEITQSCTATVGGQLVEYLSGCTVVIDPHGDVRYAIYKRGDSANRKARQLASMRGALKRFWVKRGKKYELRRDALRLLHDD